MPWFSSVLKKKLLDSTMKQPTNTFTQIFTYSLFMTSYTYHSTTKPAIKTSLNNQITTNQPTLYTRVLLEKLIIKSLETKIFFRKGKVKLSLRLAKYCAMKAYGGKEV
jgi:hypothetical protein